MKIFVVSGMCGDGDQGRIEWTVKAFYNEPEATDWANKAALRAKELIDSQPRSGVSYSEVLNHFRKNEFDPNMQTEDLYGEPTTYGVSELELV